MGRKSKPRHNRPSIQPDRRQLYEGPIFELVCEFVEDHSSLALDDTHDRERLKIDLYEFIVDTMEDDRMMVLEEVRKVISALVS